MTLMATETTTRNLIHQDAANYRSSVAKGCDGSEGFVTSDGFGPVYFTPAGNRGWHVTSHSDEMYTLTTNGAWQYDSHLSNTVRYWPTLDGAVEAFLAVVDA